MLNGQTDEGMSEITEDGRDCVQWNKFSGGRKRCFLDFKKGDEYEYWYSHGNRMRGKLKITPGNPESL
jgi:hypothetical protein